MKKKIYINVATLFGLGHVRYAPGTLGSIPPILFLFINESYFVAVVIFIIVLAILISFKEIQNIESEGVSDPSFVIIDEFVGMSLVFLMPFLPKSLFWIILSFAVFRFFDITKVYPINILNAKQGAFFVFADDILAALFTSFTIYILYVSSQILAIILL